MKYRELPRPRTEGAGRGKAIVCAFLALILVGLAAFWLTRKPEDREDLREEAADAVNSRLGETPLAGLGDLLRPSPPPPPPQLINPPTERGTLSGRVVQGTVGTPVETAHEPPLFGMREELAGTAPPPSTRPQLSLSQKGAPPAPPPRKPPQFSNVPLPHVSEDSQVTPDYLQSFARWLVDRYRPGPRGGALDVNVRSLNNLFGMGMARKAKGGRAGFLRYAMQPSMVRGLYDLYVNRFMENLDAAARDKGLSETQNRDFHLALGGRAALLATALEGVVDMPDLRESLDNIEELDREAVDLNARLADAIFELDELGAKDSIQARAARLRVEGLSARYRSAMDARELARQKLADEVRRRSGQSLDDESLLFMAAWARRRLEAGDQAEASLKACSAIMRNLAQRCAAAAREGSRQE